jgi:hypothetical protein
MNRTFCKCLVCVCVLLVRCDVDVIDGLIDMASLGTDVCGPVKACRNPVAWCAGINSHSSVRSRSRHQSSLHSSQKAKERLSLINGPPLLLFILFTVRSIYCLFRINAVDGAV